MGWFCALMAGVYTIPNSELVVCRHRLAHDYCLLVSPLWSSSLFFLSISIPLSLLLLPLPLPPSPTVTHPLAIFHRSPSPLPLPLPYLLPLPLPPSNVAVFFNSILFCLMN